MATRGSYVHNSMHGRIFGVIKKKIILCNFLRNLMVSLSDKKIHRAFRTYICNYATL